MELKSEASQLINWSPLPDMVVSPLDHTKLLFETLDQLTLRPWDLKQSGEGENYLASLERAVTDS